MKFGPAGNSDIFYSEGHTSSAEAPKWLFERGLDLYEYSFGRGIRIGADHASSISEEARNYNIEISVHSPYYINFASENPENIVKSVDYMLSSLEHLKLLGGNRCVVHPGSPSKQSREVAMDRLITNFEKLAEIIILNKYDDCLICPETMGKVNQMGSIDDIMKLCQIADFYVPCIDFGHINSRYNGYFKTADNYRSFFDLLFKSVGEVKGRKIHMHFSKIEYGNSGEIRHLQFDDTKYGPFFEQLAPVLVEYGINGNLICESKATQAEDARIMKDLYEGLAYVNER